MRLKSLSKIIQTQNTQRHVVDNLQEHKVKMDVLKALHGFLFPTAKKTQANVYHIFTSECYSPPLCEQGYRLKNNNHTQYHK